MSKQPGSNTTQNILIEKMAEQGITAKVRDREQYMNESIEKRAAYIARKETATRNTGVISEAEAMERFYQNSSRKD